MAAARSAAERVFTWEPLAALFDKGKDVQVL